MPRPKVHDSQRQRAAEACSFCRELKKRCTGVAPCAQCLGRGIGQQCFITYLPRGSRAKVGSGMDKWRPPLPHQAPPSKPQVLDVDTATTMTNLPHESRNCLVSPTASSSSHEVLVPSPSDSRAGETRANRLGELTTTPREEPVSSHKAADMSLIVSGPRMLYTDRGEPVFIGGAASLSFLETVRQVVTTHIGPSPFSHNEVSGVMLETESPQARAKSVVSCDIVENIDQISIDRKREYLQCYYDVTEALIDAFEPNELEKLLGIYDESQTPFVSQPHVIPMVRACLDMVLAIGAQCSRSPGDAEFGRACLRRAQLQLFSGFIEDPDIHVVRCFLLMAFYMLGESRRNTAYMYLSIAARGALALGLHIRESYENQASNDLKARLRIRLWLSTRIMDQLVNAILGRPAVTLAIRANLEDVVERLLPTKENHRVASVTVCSEIVSYINEIDEGLYNGNDASPTLIERYLQDIEAWKQKIPHAFDNTLMGVTGRLHISCLYYFAVSQAARPAFLLSLRNQPGKDKKDNSRSPMAVACYEASMYLSQACSDSWKAGLLRGNMCILKALVFAAGLVLGVENFAQEHVNLEVEQAFQGAKDVLAYFSTQSPQAAHYLEILNSLSTAIETRRSIIKSAEPSHYVAKLFSLSSKSGIARCSSPELTMESLTVENKNSSHSGPDSDKIANLGTWSHVQLEFPDLDVDWQSLNISQWDSFPFLSENMA